MDETLVHELLRAAERVERKLDVLIAALAEDEELPEELTLDGAGAGGERDVSQPL